MQEACGEVQSRHLSHQIQGWKETCTPPRVWGQPTWISSSCTICRWGRQRGQWCSPLARISKQTCQLAHNPWAALCKSRPTPTGLWQWPPPQTPRGTITLEGAKCGLISTECPLLSATSAQTAPEAKDRCNQLTEARISMSSWLREEGHWPHGPKLKIIRFCQLAGCWDS